VRSIPSPPSGVLDIGPIPLHAYGLMIALGVIAGAWLLSRRVQQMEIGTSDDASSVVGWGVVGGIVGARLYHVGTSWSDFSSDLGGIVKIWEGGLGIPGGLALGIAAGLWQARRRGMPVLQVATAAAPAIPLAQAIGRVGNWWNQELYGKPTDLPWGLEIDADNLVPGAPPGVLFHPTFLYEALWNVALCLVLIWAGRRWAMRPGRLMAWYLVGYWVGRFWIEGLRIDPAKSGGGLRLNQWTALIVGGGAAVFLLVDHLRHRRVTAEPVTPDTFEE
jgi:prolipoprotein diacylglyceryl transferase